MTQWTLIHRVNEGSDAESARAMEEICRQYWYPIYAFTRRSGFTPEDAEDLTQVFFQRMIASGTIQAARQERGQLRSFMLSLLKRVIANHHRDTHREKRGGSPSATVSWDDLAAEQRYTPMNRSIASIPKRSSREPGHRTFFRSPRLDCEATF